MIFCVAVWVALPQANMLISETPTTNTTEIMRSGAVSAMLVSLCPNLPDVAYISAIKKAHNPGRS